MIWTSKVEESREVFWVNWELRVPCRAMAAPDKAAITAGIERYLSML
jgi:hypothetical protein